MWCSYLSPGRLHERRLTERHNNMHIFFYYTFFYLHLGHLCMHVRIRWTSKVLMTNKLVTADAAKLLVDGGTRRVFRVDSHIGERGF